jgi:hypothetical protein
VKQDRARVALILELFVAALCLAGLFAALAARFELYLGTPVNPDLPSFVEGARDMRFLWDSGAREPLRPLTIKIAMLFGGHAEWTCRLLSAMETLGGAALLFAFARRFIGRAPALLVLALWSLNPLVAYWGVSGMRVSLYTPLLVGLAWALAARSPTEARWWRGPPSPRR